MDCDITIINTFLNYYFFTNYNNNILNYIKIILLPIGFSNGRYNLI